MTQTSIGLAFEIATQDETVAEYHLNYLIGQDKTIIWKTILVPTPENLTEEEKAKGIMDYTLKTETLVGWYYGAPEDCETIEDVEKHIANGLEAILD